MKDLTPREDVMGGSPKTPSEGIPVSTYQQVMNGSGYKIAFILVALLTGNIGLLVGMTTAWWTAREARGVTHTDMVEYVTSYEKPLADHNIAQDTSIGELKGKQEKNATDIGDLQFKVRGDERELTDFKAESKTKMNDTANLLEELRKAKR